MSPELFEKLIHAYGADRLLFGTDFPMWDSSAEVERFMKVKLTQEEQEKILCKNAERLLGLE